MKASSPGFKANFFFTKNLRPFAVSFYAIFLAWYLPATGFGLWHTQPETVLEKGDITEIRFKPFVYLNIEDAKLFKSISQLIWTDNAGALVVTQEPEQAHFIVAFIPQTHPLSPDTKLTFSLISANATGRMVVFYRNKQNTLRLVWVDQADQSAEKAIHSFLKALAQDRSKDQKRTEDLEIVETDRAKCATGSATRPVILQRVFAKSTDDSRNAGISGVVMIAVEFSSNGKLSNYQVIKGLPYGLTASALQAAKEIRFTPATCNGQPVTVRGKLEYSFNIR